MNIGSRSSLQTMTWLYNFIKWSIKYL